MNTEHRLAAWFPLGILFFCGLLEAQGFLPPDQAAEQEPAARCLTSICRNAPAREKLTTIPLPAKYMRAIVGGFEQGAGIAGGLQLTSGKYLPALELRATGLVSSRFYRRVDLEGNIPSLGSKRNHVDIRFSYMQRESEFFGIGPRTSEDLKTSFTTEIRSYQGSLYRDFANRLQAGLYAQLRNSRSSPGTIGSDPAIDTFFSSTPDQITPWIPGLLSNVKILSYGGFIEYDTRDNSDGLTRGLNLYGRLASDDGLNNPPAYADYGWLDAAFDLRGYIPLGSPLTSLALRSKAAFKNPRGGSQIPFYDLASLGGRESVRGYSSYRFRANNALLFSVEMRRTVFAKTNIRGIDLLGIVDSGQVWGDARSADAAIRANQALSSSNWRSAVGGGLQYRHSRSVGARIEVARSPEGVSAYLTMSRGF